MQSRECMVELTASKRTFTQCTCAFSSQDPNGCRDIKTSEFAFPPPDVTHNDQRHGNDRPPPMARKGNHPFMGAPYRACQRHEPPQSAKMLSWDFLVLWMRSGQPHQNHVRAAGEFQNRTQRSESQNAAGRRKRPTPPASDSFVRPLAFASLTSFFALSTSFFAS